MYHGNPQITSRTLLLVNGAYNMYCLYNISFSLNIYHLRDGMLYSYSLTATNKIRSRIVNIDIRQNSLMYRLYAPSARPYTDYANI